MTYELSKYSIFIFLSLLLIVVVSVVLTLDYHDKEFSYHDILVESHGLLFDLIVFGLILSIFDYFRNKRESLKRFNDEIDDLRLWKSEEARVKIIAKVIRLYELGQRKFFLSQTFLKNSNLSEMDLSNSLMAFIDFEGGSFVRSSLENVMLVKANLKGVYFTNAFLKNTDLSHSKCKRAYFVAADLIEVNFEKADLRKTHFINCYFENINMKDVRLEGAIVDDKNWFDSTSFSTKSNRTVLKSQYEIVPIKNSDYNDKEVFIIKKK